MALPRRVYLSASARNQLPALERDQDPLAQIVDTRTSAIVPKCDAYEIAFLRAAISDASNLPLWEPEIATDASNTLSDPRETVYSVSCSMTVTAAEPPAFPVNVGAGVDDELDVVLRDAYGALVQSGTAAVAAGPYANVAALALAVQNAIQALGGSFTTVTCTAQNGRLLFTPTATTAFSVTYSQAAASLYYGGPCSSTSVGTAVLSPNAAGLVTTHSAVFTATSKVYFVPEDLTAPVPAAPVGGVAQAWGAPFYGIFSLSSIAAMWQQAAAWCFNDATSPFNPGAPTPSPACLLSQIATWASGLGLDAALTSQPPEVSWDTSAGRFTWAFDRYATAGAAGAATSSEFLYPLASESAQWYFNGPSVYVMQALPMVWQTRAVAAGTGLDALLQTGRGINGTRQDGRAAVVLTQEMASTGSLSPVASIALVSTSMGVESELICPTTLYTSSGDPAAASSSDASLSIITDISVSDVEIANGSLVYLPDILRYTALTGGLPLKTFQLFAYWRHSKSGALIPVRLAPGGSWDVKCVFRLIGVAD